MPQCGEDERVDRVTHLYHQGFETRAPTDRQHRAARSPERAVRVCGVGPAGVGSAACGQAAAALTSSGIGPPVCGRAAGDRSSARRTTSA